MKAFFESIFMNPYVANILCLLSGVSLAIFGFYLFFFLTKKFRIRRLLRTFISCMVAAVLLKLAKETVTDHEQQIWGAVVYLIGFLITISYGIWLDKALESIGIAIVTERFKRNKVRTSKNRIDLAPVPKPIFFKDRYPFSKNRRFFFKDWQLSFDEWQQKRIDMVLTLKRLHGLEKGLKKDNFFAKRSWELNIAKFKILWHS